MQSGTHNSWVIVSTAGCVLLLASAIRADDPPADAKVPPTRWAVIVSGLPGDDEHAARFDEITGQWTQWLTQTLDFDAERVLLLKGKAGGNGRAATRESLQALFAKLATDVQESDAVWVFFLGHASYDGNRAFFHIPGPDPDAAEIARWLAPLKAREQVIWLTHASSGWFVKSIARPQRMVIAATAADFEFNETEFPAAFAAVTKRSLEELDSDQSGKVSMMELFAALVSETEAQFKLDSRVPTEHAQLDDDGDGRGTELPEMLAELAKKASGEPNAEPSKSAPAAVKTRRTDGWLAHRTFVPFRTKRPEPQTAEKEP